MIEKLWSIKEVEDERTLIWEVDTKLTQKFSQRLGGTETRRPGDATWVPFFP